METKYYIINPDNIPMDDAIYAYETEVALVEMVNNILCITLKVINVKK